MRVLIVNSGSATLKLRVLDEADTVVAQRNLHAAHRLLPGELEEALDGLAPFDASGHRIVHGGTGYTRPVAVDAEVRARLGGLVPLAPIHQPKSLAALDAVLELAPDVPAVACFDTSFHATMPPAASTYAVPATWRDTEGIRRFGFHGLSHAYVAHRAVEMSVPPGLGDAPGPRRIVSCHLGAGSSLAAVLDGRSVDTTMGFTPLEGLVMATRSGTIDPGAVLWLITERGHRPHEVADALEHASGLLGLSGTPDMREVVAGARRDDPAARLAFDVYVHRLRGGIAAMAAALGGIDTLVFTGGIGENSPVVRAAAVDGLSFLGIALDPVRNASPRLDADVSAPGSPTRVLVIAAREDIEIARGVRSVVGAT